jgi:hypothetical protein
MLSEERSRKRSPAVETSLPMANTIGQQKTARAKLGRGMQQRTFYDPVTGISVAASTTTSASFGKVMLCTVFAEFKANRYA